MQVKMCSRCGKNVAVVFITKMEGNETKNEGLCLKCARELHIKPVDEMMEKMGISDEDLDSLSGDMMNALNGVESLMDIDGTSDDSDDDGKTATFPFLNRLFGGQNGQQHIVFFERRPLDYQALDSRFHISRRKARVR